MTNIEKQLLEKAKLVKSVEELKQLAKENEIELTDEQAKLYMEKLSCPIGELDDSELDNVAGGSCHSKDGRMVVTVWHICDNWACIACGKPGKFGPGNFGAERQIQSDCAHTSSICCQNCRYCSYERAKWLCSHRSHRK